MLVEKNLAEALKDYDKGKKVLVLMTMCDGSIACEKMEELFPKDTHFLVDVPAYENPDFKAAVDNMVADGVAAPENLIGPGMKNPQEKKCHKTEEPTNDENFVGGAKQKECP